MIRTLKYCAALVAAVLLGGDVLAAASLAGASPAGFDLGAWLGASEVTVGFLIIGATLATNALTLADLAKRLGPDDMVARIIELLRQTNPILEEMPWLEGNLISGHRTTVRTGLPTVAWRLLNAGIQPSKSHTAQIDEPVGMLEAYSSVDKDLAELGGQVNAVRLSEARAFIEAMNQEMAQTLFYGAATSPEEFVGLSPRYSALTGAGNSDNVIDGGSNDTDNASIWLIAWDAETLCGIYPKGSRAGLSHEDLGLDTVENAGGVTGALMRAYRDHWQWKAGIAVKDWRYAVRIANIEVSDLTFDAATGANLVNLMTDAEERIPNELGTRAFYMNRTLRRYLRHQSNKYVQSGGGTTFENIGGKRVMMFGTTPVRVTDALINTEAVVS
jgi:hypothetical protein